MHKLKILYSQLQLILKFPPSLLYIDIIFFIIVHIYIPINRYVSDANWLVLICVLTATTVLSCRQSEFQCGNGRCIALNKACNAVNDCGDGSDEPRQCSREYMVDERLALPRWWIELSGATSAGQTRLVNRVIRDAPNFHPAKLWIITMLRVSSDTRRT